MDPSMPSLKDWVESKRSQPPPPQPAPDAEEPHMLGIPKLGDEILGGKYVVEHVIGVGGMGVVLAALHKKLGQRVAIKFLTASMQTPELVDRFIREGQAAVRIKSEHIAPVLDVGVLDNGTPYLMMEHLSGADLNDYLLERGALPIEDAVDFIIQACDALAVAHSAGIVHRDLKPSNLFVTLRSDGSPLIKVLDFGISKISARSGQPDPKSTLTRPGMMLGSPRYMSPEQLRNASTVDHRADIWAMGVVLHELVAGTPPYDADTFAALCAMIASDPPVRLRSVVPDAPVLLEDVILRCVEKDPAKRFQNVAELAAALAPLASDEARVIASRVSKILGYIPNKTPAGGYSSSKPAQATPKPSTDRTLPLAPDSGQRPSSPMASTPMPAVPSSSKNPPDFGSIPARISSENVSALAVSNAKGTRSNGARVGGLIAACLALVLVAGGSIALLKRTKPAAPTAQSASPNAAVDSLPSAQREDPSTPAPAATLPTAPIPSDIPAATAAAIAPTPQNPARPSNVRPSVPAKASASAVASAAPAPPASQAAPSEADMLNRRR